MKKLAFKNFAMLVVLALITGCQSSPVYFHRDIQKHVVVLDKREVSVLPLGHNQWEAYGGKQGGLFSTDLDKQKARQIKAIEIVSGCLVTDSIYPADHQQDKLLLRATVDCTQKPGGTLENQAK
jgi:hypothetical protein